MNSINKLTLCLVLAVSLLVGQVGGVFAAPALAGSSPLSGVVQSITLDADTITGVTTVSVDIIDSDLALQNVRLSLESAIGLGLVVLNGDGKPGINDQALGKAVEIASSSVIPEKQENQHPVGSALATFFSEIAGVDYETIMLAHEQGVGFGVIAQMLWLTTKLEGTAETFEALVEAKQTGDFSAFILEDGSSPENWGQLKKAILDGDKKKNLGVIISGSHNNQGNGSENGNGIGNNPDKDKDKDKEKDKNKNKEKENGKGKGKGKNK